MKMAALRAALALLLVGPVLSLKAKFVPEGAEDALAESLGKEFGIVVPKPIQDFVDLPPRARTTIRTPKLALNFLIKDTIHNSHVWEAWLDQGKKDGIPVKVLIHPQEAASAKAKLPTNFQQFLVNKTVASDWQHVFRAQFHLLKEALKDPDVTHVATLSDSTIPVKSLSWMMAELTQDNTTRMCGDYGGHIAETWWVMNRPDAELFKDHETLVKKMLMLTTRKQWGNDAEVGWYEPLSMRSDKWGQEAPLTLQCTTLALFNCKDGIDGEEPWCAELPDCNCPNLEKLLPEKLALEHAAEFNLLTSAAYGELLASPFWFARKFAEGAVPPEALIQ
jgi:hypothetical protein